jgi:hypothetical protein
MLRFTLHAMERFQQRIRPGQDFKPASEMAACLACANHKKVERAIKGKKQMIPLGCCMFVCQDGAVVTVLRSNKLNWENPNPDRSVPRVWQTPPTFREHVKEWRRYMFSDASARERQDA